ncbi:MAG: RNA methyltransferase [Bacteroidetes bacterium HGW-Bacteroidetes-13]|nr:MAG: RNA methyltransferase [Bacteroidetes bacterium HGW-Bacteroidetes-13]
MENHFEMLAKTLFGFEEILATELKNLGAQDVKEGVRSVSFSGDLGFLYKANLSLRTALKILIPIHSFNATNEQAFYRGIYAVDWKKHISNENTFAVQATTVNSTVFTHSQFIALKAKDAIVDQFRESTGKRPNVDTQHPDLQIHIHINENSCSVSLDSSGSSLHQRGYRSATNIAPINEVLAAGILLLSGWEGQSDFLDPMCGSGTIPIEAAMIAANIPANIHRKEFAFEKWDNFDETLFEKIRESLLKKTRDFSFKIFGYDKAESAINKAIDNVKNAGLDEFITLKTADFFETQKSNDEPLHMVFNPPYGERIQANIPVLYKSIGDTLKQSYPDTRAWLITSEPEGLKHIGLRPSRKIKVFNGGLESRLLYFPMYAGSKRQKFQQTDKS